MIWNRIDFEKNISLNIKREINFEKIWNTESLVHLDKISEIKKGTSITQDEVITGNIPVIAGGQKEAYYHNQSNRKGNIITVSASGAYAGFVNFFDKPIFASDCNTIQSRDETRISTQLIFYFLKSIQNEIYKLQRGQAQPHVYSNDLLNIEIPLISKNIQEKIVKEIEILEDKEEKVVRKVKDLKSKIRNFYFNNGGSKKRLDEICEMKAGKFVKAGDINRVNNSKRFHCYGGNGLRGYTETFTNDGQFSLIGRQGALCGNVHLVSGKFHATEHALVVYPKKNTNTIWLYYKLMVMNLNQYATGLAQPGLSVIHLNPIEIYVPPLSEQNKIVKEIETTEKEILKLEEQIEKIPQFKKDVLMKYLQ